MLSDKEISRNGETIRKLVFVSHATPEDNDFARWLAVKLAAAGYVVWADVEQLIGGEKFWKDIEEAISRHAAKVLFCGSKASLDPRKTGVLRELSLAQKAEATTGLDILVPLKLDDTPFSSFPSGLSSEVNIIRFDTGWAGGLSAVIRVLERAQIYREPNPQERVTEWWTHRFSASEGVSEGSQTHISNIFPLTDAPIKLWFHRFRRTVPTKFDYQCIPFPARPYADGIITPANIEDTRRIFAAYGYVDSNEITLSTFLNEGWPDICMSIDDARKRAYWMMRFAFHRLAVNQGFSAYPLAGKNECFWLRKKDGQKYEFPFADWNGTVRRRSLIGYSSYGISVNGLRKRRFWHFAVQARPIFSPIPALIIKPHVVFTEDGNTLLDSDAKQHAARRASCKSWWNDAWRDRILCLISCLSDNGRTIPLPFGNSILRCSALPITLDSVRSYKEIERQPTEKLPYEIRPMEEDADYTGEADE